MTQHEYAQYDGLGLAELIRSGHVSVNEAARAARALVERLNPTLNAIVRFAATAASPGAANSTARNATTAAPFGGVPFLLKDNLEVAGDVVTFGSVLLKDERAHVTHEVARRMLASGVNVLGRSNLSEYGLLPYTESTLFGPARNPWNLDYSTGGSSGGTAAAVAAGIVPFSHGNDGGGSLRIPASCCGLFGLKPSRGRNPALEWGYDGSLAVNHVLSRTVRDSAAMLDATAGPRPGEPWVLPKPEQPYLEVIRRDPPRLRIGFTATDFSGHAADPECLGAVETMARWCEDLGHEVEEAAPEIDGPGFNEAFMLLWAQGAGFVYRRAQEGVLHRREIPPPLRPLLKNRAIFRSFLALARREGKPVLEAFTRKLAAIDASHSPSDLLAAQVQLKRAERALASFFTSYDLLLTPVLGEPPHRIGSFGDSWGFDRMQEHLYRYVAYTPIANTTGLPAMSVPTAWTAKDLPVGTQFMSPLGREDLLLQVAAQIERAQPWTVRRPGTSAWAD
ncbi:MAG: amidase [Spirochaetes bacterium]|jgi:amidase|nr:amidase [Spirochaetota bacterium]